MKAAYGFVGPIAIAVTDSGWTHLSSFPDLAKRGGVRGEMTPLRRTRISNSNRTMQPTASLSDSKVPSVKATAARKRLLAEPDQQRIGPSRRWD